MIEFILARYNYWIVIALMMTGLYIVFSRGNLVKTLIGLNVFQTSVFIFYITVGKVIGGTAPILMDDHAGEGEAHGGEHGGAADHDGSISEAPSGFYAENAAGHLDAAGEPLHLPEETADAVAGQGSLSREIDTAGHLGAHGTPALDASPAEAAHGTAEILYSNPLPHVLILTAIVVGVATTAVGLSLAVRIREAYGTVEEDDLVSIDSAEETMEAAR